MSVPYTILIHPMPVLYPIPVPYSMPVPCLTLARVMRPAIMIAKAMEAALSGSSHPDSYKDTLLVPASLQHLEELAVESQKG